MNIVACVKQVPDTEAQIKVKGDASGIDEGGIKWVMNPYDEFGVEEALKLKEKLGGEVTIVSVGPARTMETIRTALAMGADKGIHIDDAALYGADAYATAEALAAAIKGIPYDMIFCGQRAIDDDSGQIGSILAEILGVPSVTMATKLEVAGTAAKATRPIEGAQLVIETSLPCVITATKGLNEPPLCIASRYHEGQEETSRCQECRRSGCLGSIEIQGRQIYTAAGKTAWKDHLRGRYA